MNKKSLNEIFELNLEHLIHQTENYIARNKKINEINELDLNSSREYVVNSILEKNIEQAIMLLEDLREKRQGIVTCKIFTPHYPPILIRDARRCNHKIVRCSESFEIQYLNLIRSSLDILSIENKKNLCSLITMSGAEFIKSFHSQNLPKSQSHMRNNFQIALKNLLLLLESSGIENALEKLNVSKDFQNFNDLHADILTLSALKSEEKTYTVFEAEVALRGLTSKQLEEYYNILLDNGTEPEWFKSLPLWEQLLCKKYIPTIIRGKHVISSQLRQIVGMRNAFEKITGIINYTDRMSVELKILHKSKHAGCLASFSRHENSRQYIANLNAEQAQEWIGPQTTLHCNTFNSGPEVGKESDKMIVTQTIKAMAHIKGRITNTAYDSFRTASGANLYDGANYLIDTFSKALNHDRRLDIIINYLGNKSKDSFIPNNDNLIKYLKSLYDSNIIGGKTYTILNILLDMKWKIAISKKGSPGHLNLDISMSLNILLNTINSISLPSDLRGMSPKKLPKEEILNMCALGQDRTGFSEHIQSVKALENIMVGKLLNIDEELLAAGHTSLLSGATYSGGGSIGCYGIKEDSVVYFPKKRSKALSAILEHSASGNKLFLDIEPCRVSI